MSIISGWEWIILLIVFLLVIGPQRLPEYTRNVVRLVRQARHWVDSSRATVEDEMGVAMDDLRKYDPRQYDPRKIIREAWDDTGIDDVIEDTKDLVGATAPGAKTSGKKGAASSRKKGSKKNDGPKRAPFDDEAT